jgi:hypothetical protein
VTSTAFGTVTINLNGSATYFVKSVPAGLNNCTLGHECTLATAVSGLIIGINSNTNKRIFISDANTHSTAVPLNADGWLIGQGVTGTDFATVMGYTGVVAALPSGAAMVGTFPNIAQARPTIGGMIMLNTNSNVRGLNINVTGINKGLVAIAPAKTGLVVNDLGTIQSVNGNAVDLANATGTFAFANNITTTGAGGGVVFVNTNGGAGVSFANVSAGPGGAAVSLTSTGSTTYSFNNISSTTGAAFSVTTSSGNFTFNNVTSTNGVAVTVNSSSTGDFIFNTVTSTTGPAVDINGASGDFDFVAINANGAGTGILVQNLVAPGTFEVAGSGVTLGSGGTVQNCTAKGADFRSSANITLTNMNFTNNATSDGPGANCHDIVSNTTNNGPANCNSNISFLSATNVVLTRVSATLSNQIGIDGQSVNGLAMHDVTVTGNGDEVGEDGVQMANLSGTVTVDQTGLFKDNAANQFEIVNSTGTMNATVTNSEFSITNFPSACGTNGPSPGNCTANSGLYLIGTTTGSSTMNATVTGNVFANIYSFGLGLNLANSAGSTFNAGTAGNGNTFTNIGLPIVITNTGSGTTNYGVRDNTITNNTAVTVTFATTAISVSMGGSGTRTGVIDNNNVGTNLVGSTASGCFVSGCDGIQVTDSAASGTHNTTITNNKVYHVNGGAVRVTSSGGSTDTFRVAVANNTANFPDNALSAVSGILVQDGNSSPNGVIMSCVNITGNDIKGLWAASTTHKSAIRILATRAQQFALTNFNTGTEYPAGTITAGCTIQCTGGVGIDGNAADFLSQQNPLTVTAQSASGGSSATQQRLAASAGWSGTAGLCP